MQTIQARFAVIATATIGMVMLMSAVLPARIQSQAGEEEPYPVYLEEIGKVGGSQNDNSSVGVNGVKLWDSATGEMNIAVLYPIGTSAINSESLYLHPGGGYSGAGPVQAEKACGDYDETFELCTFTFDAYKYFESAERWGSYRIIIQGATTAQNVQAPSESNANYNANYGMAFVVEGSLRQPFGQFEMENARVVTDSALDSVELKVRVNDDAANPVENVIFDIGSGESTLVATSSVAVSDSSFPDGTARDFTVDWDISKLESGRRTIRAETVDASGVKTNVYNLDTTSDFTNVTIAVTVDQRLLEQCNANKDAVVSLIASINDDLSESNLELGEIASQIERYALANDLADINTLNPYVVANVAFADSWSDLQAASEISCSVSLADDIAAYRLAYEASTEALSDMKAELLVFANVVLSGDSNGQ